MPKQQKLETDGGDSFINDYTSKENVSKATGINRGLTREESSNILSDFKDFCQEIDEITLIEDGLENDFTTKCLYHKLQFEEGMTAFYTFAAIITACISYEAKKTNLPENNNYQVFTLTMVSIFNVLFCKRLKLKF